jgi:hypothetical protein
VPLVSLRRSHTALPVDGTFSMIERTWNSHGHAGRLTALSTAPRESNASTVTVARFGPVHERGQSTT